MSTYFSRLKLNVQAPLKLKDLTYKFFVINNATKKTTTFEGSFDEQGLTGWTEIYNLNTMLIYEVYLRGESLQRIAVKAYPNKKTHSTFTIKMTTEITQKVKQNIKEIYLDDGEVAWYLIKKTETMQDWSKRVFKKPLVASDWDTLKANNPHISNMAPIRLLTPGMVIVLSNSTTAKELAQYKKDAQEAQKNLDQMNKDKDFDAEFFAQNYEFLLDIYSENQVVASKHEVFNDPNAHPLTHKFESPVSSESSGIAWGTIAKGGIDASMNFSVGAMAKLSKVQGEITLKYNEEAAKGSRLANPKHESEFRRKYSSLYRQFDNNFLNDIFRWDRGIQTQNMRKVTKSTALIRDPNYKGGTKAYAKNMAELGKISKYVKGGGLLFIGLDIYNAGNAIADAKPEEKERTAVVETSKIVGGLTGGMIVSAVVIGLASGGTGWVVLGVAAGLGAVASWAVGTGTGLGAEYVYDKVNDRNRK
ncbi:hypothetical protein NDN13_02645 [Acinetobacter sp. C32I]|uniref:hypothetical protein n=1 Tax=Acinetobacter sp. C32I TaxID=2950074 RepID=UPI00203765D0|nr:hypothetical protein [Acinetobacter sp. C32I]USA54115.1 hypothetical protein NDN13_02645 [Acinetobacter sp. C32I]